MDEHGRTTRAALERRWAELEAARRTGWDHREALRHRASPANHLRTYRRSVLLELGGFDESHQLGVDYDMALRILERYEIALVPEFLYARRLHSTNSTRGHALVRPRLWWTKYRIRAAAVRSGRVTYWRRAPLGLGLSLIHI